MGLRRSSSSVELNLGSLSFGWLDAFVYCIWCENRKIVSYEAKCGTLILNSGNLLRPFPSGRVAYHNSLPLQSPPRTPDMYLGTTVGKTQNMELPLKNFLIDCIHMGMLQRQETLMILKVLYVEVMFRASGLGCGASERCGVRIEKVDGVYVMDGICDCCPASVSLSMAGLLSNLLVNGGCTRFKRRTRWLMEPQMTLNACIWHIMALSQSGSLEFVTSLAATVFGFLFHRSWKATIGAVRAILDTQSVSLEKAYLIIERENRSGMAGLLCHNGALEWVVLWLLVATGGVWKLWIVVRVVTGITIDEYTFQLLEEMKIIE
ncbi:uncharacterized protein BDR25DRAFT_349201 [Lindgomyces ingoldianus]|uniref:Uncharacterized protein n=1 Tax=Lindgomyces ingoldianus TaxID=673940 RepID=A0ACB6RDI8_9PLEO|nr:uncharacterized protein BDR25DRAFT_349201 [Lindgomyces ingoldianus]KAF2477256.1 hypothetical protein BDR25DRAFT_349201 [Lindgomyces ingoldianus]